MKPRFELIKLISFVLIVFAFITIFSISELNTTLAAEKLPGLEPPPVWQDQIPSASIQDQDLSQSGILSYDEISANDWINPQSRLESANFYKTGYLPNFGIAINWTGNHASCNAGTTSESFRTSIFNVINYFRSMAGVPWITGLNSTYNAKAQEAALMMSVNNDLNHYPPHTWTCYSADGYDGAGKSNLFLGSFGPSAISGFVNDFGVGNEAVGHRRWILYPQTQYMGTGDIPPVTGYLAANALWVSDGNYGGTRPTTRDGYVAWPPPGYVPYQVIYQRWSFSYPNANFSSTTVSMTKNGQPLSLNQKSPVSGYGENTIVWEPGEPYGAKPTADTVYQVNLTNVGITSSAQNYSYTVIIFDPDNVIITNPIYLPMVVR